MSGGELATRMVSRGTLRLRPDPGRVIAALFVPGEEMVSGDSRAAAVTERILAMDDADATATLADLRRRFAPRHRHLEATWLDHFRLAARRHRAVGRRPRRPSAARRGLFHPGGLARRRRPVQPVDGRPPRPERLGPRRDAFRHEPAGRRRGPHLVHRVPHRHRRPRPVQFAFDDPGKFLETGEHSPGPYTRRLFHAKLAERGCDNQAAALVLDRLGAAFGPAELDSAIEALHSDLLSRAAVREAVLAIRWVAANNYTVEFPTGTQDCRASALAPRPGRGPRHGRCSLRPLR